ncbi:MAG: SdrD B-like domain-containing protein [Acidimicrobiales bacterium]
MPRPRCLARRVGAAAAVAVLAAGLGGALWSGPAAAEGTETLGPPSIETAAGAGVAIGAVGLYEWQPATLRVSTPTDAEIRQVLLYWEGQSASASAPAASLEACAADAGLDWCRDELLADGHQVTGVLVGGPTLFYHDGLPVYSATYRADVTGLGVVAAGPAELTVGGLDFNRENNGVGAVVIYSQAGRASAVELRDGNDLAYGGFTGSLQSTAAQSFTLEPAPVERAARLMLMASSVADRGRRPTVVQVRFDGELALELVDPFDNSAGEQFDTLERELSIPAGVGEVSVQALSQRSPASLLPESAAPASFAWLVGALVAETPAPPLTTTDTPPTEPPPTEPPPTEPPPPTPPTGTPPRDQTLGRVAVGDRVWLDRDGDGRQGAGEPGVGGVRVVLCDEAGAPVPSADGEPTATVTDAEGGYGFAGLAPGRWSACFDLATIPAGHTVSPRDAGDDDALDSDADPATGRTAASRALAAGEDDLTLDLGIVAIEPTDCVGRPGVDGVAVCGASLELLPRTGLADHGALRAALALLGAGFAALAARRRLAAGSPAR